MAKKNEDTTRVLPPPVDLGPMGGRGYANVPAAPAAAATLPSPVTETGTAERQFLPGSLGERTQNIKNRARAMLGQATLPGGAPTSGFYQPDQRYMSEASREKQRQDALRQQLQTQRTAALAAQGVAVQDRWQGTPQGDEAYWERAHGRAPDPTFVSGRHERDYRKFKEESDQKLRMNSGRKELAAYQQAQAARVADVQRQQAADAALKQVRNEEQRAEDNTRFRDVQDDNKYYAAQRRAAGLPEEVDESPNVHTYNFGGVPHPSVVRVGGKLIYDSGERQRTAEEIDREYTFTPGGRQFGEENAQGLRTGIPYTRNEMGAIAAARQQAEVARGLAEMRETGDTARANIAANWHLQNALRRAETAESINQAKIDAGQFEHPGKTGATPKDLALKAISGDNPWQWGDTPQEQFSNALAFFQSIESPEAPGGRSATLPNEMTPAHAPNPIQQFLAPGAGQPQGKKTVFDKAIRDAAGKVRASAVPNLGTGAQGVQWREGVVQAGPNKGQKFRYQVAPDGSRIPGTNQLVQ